MRYSLDSAMAEIRRRSEAVREEKRRRSTRRLSSGCVLLLFLQVLVFRYFAGAPRQGLEQTSYGATVVPVEAGGYIIVGVVCFCAAVVITMFCLRHRDSRFDKEKNANEGQNDNDNDNGGTER